uniref:AlNc14C276G10048 protein n=1 Tax=Albugo laibachii Nc14 TaxID=890382 RepID=F0WUP1_9STRA|nr:AlNc14C276G10048 [Albugo laibachii Nc14]|eukprot:CCA25122.1 AlNc14C276G10048 [Albugo laibachii Nc14]
MWTDKMMDGTQCALEFGDDNTLEMGTLIRYPTPANAKRYKPREQTTTVASDSADSVEENHTYFDASSLVKSTYCFVVFPVAVPICTKLKWINSSGFSACQVSPKGLRVEFDIVLAQCKQRRTKTFTSLVLSGHQKTSSIALRVASIPQCPPTPKCATIHSRRQSLDFSGGMHIFPILLR